MATTAEIIYRLTEASLNVSERQRSLCEFAQEAGWYPSDDLLDYPGTEKFANGHLLVEHGMANTAVITFLKTGYPFHVLEKASRIRLLELSYNNLVDWHLIPDSRGLTAIYNRTDPPKDFRFEGGDSWRADYFSRISGQRVKPELKALDEAFISTVSYWKRVIGGELGAKATNERLSALFNVLIFVRAYEDYSNRISLPEESRILVNTFAESPKNSIKLICVNALKKLPHVDLPQFMQELIDQLSAFDALDSETVGELLANFYRNRFSPYRYDFSLISKHALSRIYEHYVSILRNPQTEQRQLFPDLAEELTNKALGSFYTPQYIARFFARYIKEHTSPKEFREMKIVDPACGSGIFLRTALELKCDPLELLNRGAERQAFEKILGLDLDPSACEASKLSLSLLHLVLTGKLPSSLNIKTYDAVDYILKNTEERNSYGAVMANPPYIRWESQATAWQQNVSEYLGDLRQGKTDAYVALLKVGMDLVKPGGFAMFVLPHTFLHSNSTKKLRELIAKEFWIRLIADLSDIAVFEDVSSYTILLIIQKKNDHLSIPSATVVKCRSEVGEALDSALRGRVADNEYYRVYESPQVIFANSAWKLLPPAQQHFTDNLEKFPKLSSFAKISQGVITGADNVFIRHRSEIPLKDMSIWRPLLADREMTPYVVPDDVERFVFYPVVDSNRLSQEDIEKIYPLTWSYLKLNESKLRSRKSLAEPGSDWWRPIRLRETSPLFTPKVVCPHLMLTPRFAIDISGKYAVTRSPYIIPAMKYASGGVDLLKYFVALLNSSFGFWQITTQSQKYSRQYAMIENKTLGQFRIPDPQKVPMKDMKRLIGCVDRITNNGPDYKVVSDIDEIVAMIYGYKLDMLHSLGIS